MEINSAYAEQKYLFIKLIRIYQLSVLYGGYDSFKKSHAYNFYNFCTPKCSPKKTVIAVKPKTNSFTNNTTQYPN